MPASIEEPRSAALVRGDEMVKSSTLSDKRHAIHDSILNKNVLHAGQPSLKKVRSTLAEKQKKLMDQNSG